MGHCLLKQIHPVWLLIYLSATASTKEEKTCPMESWDFDGDVVIGYLVNIHQGNTKDNKGVCSQLLATRLIEVEAINFVIKKLSQHNYINGVKLGLSAWDSCTRRDVAVGNMLKLRPETRESKCGQPSTLAGVIGSLLSPQMADVAESLRDSTIPILGTSCTADSLTYDKDKYKTLMRLVLPDKFQAKALAQLVVKLKWTKVSVVHTTDNYGREATREFLRLLDKHEVCKGDILSIDADYKTHQQNRPHEIIKKISMGLQNEASGSLGVVYIGQRQEASGLIEACHKNPMAKGLMWIMSDAVGNDNHLLDGYREIAQNVMSISPMYVHIKELEDHWVDMIYNVTNTRTKEQPWVQEYADKILKCKDNGKCPESTKSDIRKLYFPPDNLVPALDTAYVMVKALHTLHTSKCKGEGYLCENMKDALRTQEFFDLVKNTDFTYPSNFPYIPEVLNRTARRIRFNINGDIELNPTQVDYVINHYRCDNLNCRFLQVGNFSNARGIQLEEIKFHATDGSTRSAVRLSMCTQPTREHLAHIDGEYLTLAAMIPVHLKGKTTFGAGKPSVTGEILKEAFLWAINEANAWHKDGTKLGGVVLDTYSDSQKASRDILNLLAPSSTLYFKGLSNMYQEGILGFLIGETDMITTVVSPLINRLQKVLIDYGTTLNNFSIATSGGLNHSLRISQPNAHQLLPLALVCKRFSWRKIGVIYSDDMSSRDALDIAKKIFWRNGICISNEMKFEEVTVTKEKISELESWKQSGIRIVLSLVHPDVLVALFQKLTLNTREVDKNGIILLGGTWLFDGIEQLIEPERQPAHNAIVVTPCVSLPVPLTRHLISLRSEQNQTFRQLGFQRPLKQNILMQQMVTAVFAFRRGLERFISDLKCPRKGVCDKLKRPNLRTTIRLHKYVQNALAEMVQEVSSGCKGNQQSIFTYNFLNADGFSWTEHRYGNYSETLGLQLESLKEKEHHRIKSHCKDTDTCGVCTNRPALPRNPMRWEILGPVMACLIISIGGHFLVWLLFCRERRCRIKDCGRSLYENPDELRPPRAAGQVFGAGQLQAAAAPAPPVLPGLVLENTHSGHSGYSVDEHV